MSSILTLRGTRFIPYLTLLVTITACSAGSAQSAVISGGDDTTASAASAPGSARGVRDACALITKAEVDSILKTSVTVTPSADGATSSCDYMPTGSGDGFSLKVHWTGGKEELALTKRVTRIAPKMMKGGGIDPAGRMALEPIDDLGDEAYFNAIYGSSVLKGDVLMEFDLRLMMFYTQSPAEATEHWKALVRRALSRL